MPSALCDLSPRARGPPCAILACSLSMLHRDLDIRTVPALPMMKAKATAFDSLNPVAAACGDLRHRRVPDKGVSAGPLLILAGAGTGKTNTLAHRTAHLVLNGVDPARILMLTFTRRAAQEMIRRTQHHRRGSDVGSRQGGRSQRGDRGCYGRGTFHSVGNRILRLYAKHLGLDPNFTVLDRADAADIMDVVRHELGYSAQGEALSRARMRASPSIPTASIPACR